MNRRKLIITLVSIGVASAVGLGVYFFINNNSKQVEDDYTQEQQKEIDSVKEDIEVKTETKEYGFETFEEMSEFMDNIGGPVKLEEATSFLTEFLGVCETNSIKHMVTYYEESIWDFVIANKWFPSYDESNLFMFEFSNIEVECVDEEKSTYKVKYDLIIKEKNNEFVGKLEREDTFYLQKMYGRITISNYERLTKNVEE